MRRLRTLAVSAVFGLSLAACSQGGSGAMGAIDVDPKTVEAHVTKLAGEAIKGKATAAVDLAAVRDMLPPEVALTWGNLSFDAATGSTLVTDLKLTPKDNAAVGVGIAELRLYDLDIELLKARVSGQRLAETAPLARRIDAKGVAAFGLADMMNGMMGAAYDSFSDDAFPAPPQEVLPAEPANPLKFQPADPNAPVTPEDWPPSTDPDFGFDDSDFDFSGGYKVDRYDFSIGRIILDDIVLKPYTVAPAPAAAPDPNDPMADVWPVISQLAAVTQSFGVDTAAYLDFKAGMDVTQFGESMTTDMVATSMGVRGMRGGDYDAMYMRGLSYTTKGASAGVPMDISYAVDLFTLEDFRLGKVMDYLAKGVVPPRTETGLMSLGIWRSEKESMKFAGADFYSVDETMLDASGWHWFIPTKLHATGKNLSFNVGGFMKTMQDIQASAMAQYGPEYQDPEAAAQMQQVAALIDKHGLSKPTFNYDNSWNWNAANGDAKLGFLLDGADFMKIDAKYEGGFPSFKAVSDLIPDQPTEENFAAVGKVFETNSTLKLIEFNVQDKGGLPKVYGLIGDMAPMMQPGAQPMTADNVRQMAAGGMEMMAAGASSQIPEIPALINPIAAFMKEGGKLRIAAQPSKPTPFTTLSGTMMGVSMGMASPSQVIKDLGLKSEHSK